jgi:HlyD family secretion protein
VRKRLPLLLGGVLVALAAGAFFFMRTGYRPPTDALLVSGNIEAHESLLSFKRIQSKITELPFEEGQWVEKGTQLARADDDDYRQQAVLDESQLSARQQELASAEQNLIASRQTMLAAEADAQQKRTNYERIEQLWQQQVVASQTRDQDLSMAKQADAVVQRDRALIGVAEKNVGVARANVRAAADALRLTRITLGYTVLRAPFSGVILVRNGELGEAVQPGTPIVTLADLDHVWLRAYLNETDLGRVAWGQPAVVTTDTWPGKRYRGRISFISSEAEFTPKSVETHAERVTLVYRIKIDVENPRHELKPGMPADASIDLSSADHRPLLQNGQPALH